MALAPPAPAPSGVRIDNTLLQNTTRVSCAGSTCSCRTGKATILAASYFDFRLMCTSNPSNGNPDKLYSFRNLQKKPQLDVTRKNEGCYVVKDLQGNLVFTAEAIVSSNSGHIKRFTLVKDCQGNAVGEMKKRFFSGQHQFNVASPHSFTMSSREICDNDDRRTGKFKIKARNSRNIKISVGKVSKRWSEMNKKSVIELRPSSDPDNYYHRIMALSFGMVFVSKQ